MRSIHFDVQGFNRTYWDLFVAAGFSVGVFYLFTAVLAWQLGGLPAESRAAQATLGCPGTAQAGQQFTVEVAIDVGTRPLGAYTITVDYDPTVVTVASVAGGNTTEFSGTPATQLPG